MNTKESKELLKVMYRLTIILKNQQWRLNMYGFRFNIQKLRQYCGNFSMSKCKTVHP